MASTSAPPKKEVRRPASYRPELTKLSSLPPGATQVFQSVVEKCLETVQKSPSSAIRDHKQTVEGKTESTSISLTNQSEEEIVGAKKGVEVKPGRTEGNEEAKADEIDDDDEEEEEEDYTYLHIMKKDSAEYQESMSQMKKEVEAYSRNENLQANFISLDSGNKTNSKVIETSQSNLGKRKQSTEIPKFDDKLKSDIKKRRIDEMNVSDTTPLKGLVSEPNQEHNEGNKPSDFMQREVRGEKSDFVTTQKETILKDETEHAALRDIAKTEIQCSKSNTVEAVSTPPLFTISRKGEMPTSGSVGFPITRTASDKDTASTVIKSECKKDKILGNDETVQSGKKTGAEMEAEHIKKVFEATAISSQGKRKKRKHEAKEGFISLAYTPANIHTMVNDVSKKKKKKKKKIK